jgi:hypothetical protein
MPSKKREKKQPRELGELRPEDVKNAFSAPAFYCNNFQIQGGLVDVWMLFNEVIPNGQEFQVERKVSVVMSVPQFFAIVNMMSQQAQKIQATMQQAADQNKLTVLPAKQ